MALRTKDPGTVAAAVHRVLDDGTVRQALVGAARTQLDRFALPVTRRQMVDALGRVL